MVADSFRSEQECWAELVLDWEHAKEGKGSYYEVDGINDRSPITPVAKPEFPFQVVNLDLIGPIDPPSSKGHKYILCLIDQRTRWGEALPLTSLSAKGTCEVLLSIFSRTGIPNVIASDNGANFASKLTKEFEKRMESSPRFSTPGYPQYDGLVEMFNRTSKNMLHNLIREEGTE
ncbi:retrovirus-related Pol polyprotein from transposon opus [Nephila pilipes]|uniref:Retrovirus-related Pol polyprotein from transposon opus n=1 Tax=Nephila pilipes TaxID=299642 RepID=A0A8X6MZM4_NEPPI|nr:retrovirus-related Pol polyprotein from transposon opus [Nephila pilipes]